MANEAEKKRIYDQWHEMIAARDVNGLMTLYTDDAVLESSAVLVIERDQSGTIRGKDKLRSHFQAFFDMVGPSNGRQWERPGKYLSDADRVLWEYPSKGSRGEQLDVVESCDLQDGLISYHRVYWGWKGFQLLMAAMKSSVATS